MLLEGCSAASPSANASAPPATASHAAESDRSSPQPATPTRSSTPSTTAAGAIAFHADPNGDSGLYVTNADGTGVHLVTGRLRGYPFAKWSPDGSALAFLVGSYGVGRLQVVNLDGSHERTVGKALVIAFAWSPDGQRLVYEDAHEGGVWVIDANGSAAAQQLTTSGHPTEWSPDGEWIAFFDGPEGASQIYRIRPAGGPAEALTQGGADVSPTWSPDGSKIAFVSSRDGNLELYVMAADGSDLRRLTNDPAPDGVVRWSPDAAQLAYVSYRDGADPLSIGIGNAEVYVLDLDAGVARNISNDPAWDGDPAWAPDGAWIASRGARIMATCRHAT